jgi:hypothetical protein
MDKLNEITYSILTINLSICQEVCQIDKNMTNCSFYMTYMTGKQNGTGVVVYRLNNNHTYYSHRMRY